MSEHRIPHTKTGLARTYREHDHLFLYTGVMKGDDLFLPSGAQYRVDRDQKRNKFKMQTPGYKHRGETLRRVR